MNTIFWTGNFYIWRLEEIKAIYIYIFKWGHNTAELFAFHFHIAKIIKIRKKIIKYYVHFDEEVYLCCRYCDFYLNKIYIVDMRLQLKKKIDKVDIDEKFEWLFLWQCNTSTSFFYFFISQFIKNIKLKLFFFFYT